MVPQKIPLHYSMHCPNVQVRDSTSTSCSYIQLCRSDKSLWCVLLPRVRSESLGSPEEELPGSSRREGNAGSGDTGADCTDDAGPLLAREEVGDVPIADCLVKETQE